MPPRTRSCRKAAAKRNILGVLSETEPSEFTSNGVSSNVSEGKQFKIPSNFDGTSKESVTLLLEDLEKEVKQMQSNLSLLEFQANKELQEVYFLKTLKLERNIRNMTVRDYNAKYLNGGSLIQMVKGLCEDTVLQGSQTVATSNNNGHVYEGRMETTTPLRSVSKWKGMKTPATIARTARRGEAIFSANGSPLDASEEEGVVATVLKKRKGEKTAVFDINIGGGKVISLNDPSMLMELDEEMKLSAMSHIRVFHEQMTTWMSVLGGQGQP